jgi:lipocalin-like protein
MKKIAPYLLLTFAIISTTALTSCNKNSSTEIAASTEDKLEGKWIIVEAIGSYTMDGTNHKDTTAYTADDSFTFNSDNTLVITESGSTHTGKWKVTNNKLIISETNYVDYPNGFDIAVLTTANLTLSYSETDASSSLEQKLNLKR